MRHNWTPGRVNTTQWSSGTSRFLGLCGEAEGRPTLSEKWEGGEVKQGQGRKICQAGSKWPQDTQETDCAGGGGNGEGYKEASQRQQGLKGFKERKSSD